MASINPGVAHSEAGHPRKRLKISRSGAKISTTPTDTAVIPAVSTTTSATESSRMAQNHVHDGTCHHESALKTLHTDVDAMRHLVTCQICHRFMYEPYALSCGHTYCYSCLTQWMGSNSKKTCPDCRAVITQQPTPSYVIRELVLIFASRNQLLPDGETSEEHTTMAREEAELVAKDKANTDPRTGGLFKGCFSKAGGRARLMPMHDPGDGVDRCPHCHWELEDGYCNHCGEAVDDNWSSDSESINSQDEIDHDFGDFDNDAELGFAGGPVHIDLDTDDENAVWGDHEAMHADFHGAGALPAHAGHGAHRQNRHRHGRVPVVVVSDQSEDDSDSESDEHSSDIGFIDDDVHYQHEAEHEAQMDDSSETEVEEAAHHLQSRRRRRVPVVISDDEDDGDAGTAHQDAISIESSDDEAPVLGTVGRTKRNRVAPTSRARPVVLSDSEESSSVDDDESTVQGQQPEFTNGGFSPLEQASDDDDESTVHHQPEWTTRHLSFSEQDNSEDEESVPDTHFDHTDATSEADDMQPPFFHEVSEEESSDDNAENGYQTASTAEPPASVRTSNHRLQTNVQRRDRYHNALHAQAVHRSPIVAIPGRTQRPEATGHGDSSPFRYLSSSSEAPPTRTHPFNLDNTLANINNRSRRQREPSNASDEVPGPASITSSRSSTSGGVGVGASQQSLSSSGSSHTIGRAAPTQSRRQREKRPLNLGGRMPWGYDTAGRR